VGRFVFLIAQFTGQARAHTYTHIKIKKNSDMIWILNYLHGAEPFLRS